MAKTRWTGRGGTVAFETTAFTTPPTWNDAVGLCRNIAPPPQELSQIDVTGMEDVSSVTDVGIEQQSVFSFTCLHASTDTLDTTINTMYDSGEERKWRVRRTNGTNDFDSVFTGVVMAIRPSAFGGSDPILREVIVHRTGSAITHTVQAVT